MERLKLLAVVIDRLRLLIGEADDPLDLAGNGLGVLAVLHALDEVLADALAGAVGDLPDEAQGIGLEPRYQARVKRVERERHALDLSH